MKKTKLEYLMEDPEQILHEFLPAGTIVSWSRKAECLWPTTLNDYIEVSGLMTTFPRGTPVLLLKHSHKEFYFAIADNMFGLYEYVPSVNKVISVDDKFKFIKDIINA